MYSMILTVFLTTMIYTHTINVESPYFSNFGNLFGLGTVVELKRTDLFRGIVDEV